MPIFFVNKIIIHELVKDQHERIKENKYGPRVLDSSSEIVNKLVESIVAIYGKKNNTAQYGTFVNGAGRGSFPNAFESYMAIPSPTDHDFIELTKNAMVSLYNKAQGRSGASGGYILFADYVTDPGRFFVIVMIKQKSGITLSENLEPLELIELDLSRIHQAARVNFSKFSGFMTTSDPRRKDELNYLSFISPKMSKATAGYFITALGCSEGAASAQATKNLIDESLKFFKTKDELKNRTGEFREKLIDYLDEKAKYGASVKLSHIEAIAREFMPSDEIGQADDLADELISHLHGEPISIPVEFSVNKPTLHRYTYIKGKANNWDIKFSKSALGDDENAEIYYDADNNQLLIKELPQGLIADIKKTLEERRQETEDELQSTN